MSRPDGQRKFLPALTSMRFLAAFHVVIYHFFPMPSLYRAVEATQAHPVLNLLVRGLIHFIGVGYIEVGLFFILSGFILAYTYLDETSNRKSSVADFALSRFARIYPIYVCAWACAGLYAVMLTVMHKGRVVESGGHLAIDALTSLFCVQAWSRTLGGNAWNGAGWSISAELFFYVMFALMFLRPAAKASFSSGRFVLSVIVATLLLKLGGAVAYFAIHPDGFHFWEMVPTMRQGALPWQETLWMDGQMYSPLFRIGEFMLGVGLARIFMERRTTLNGGTQLAISRLPTVLVLGTYAVLSAVAGAYLPSLALSIVVIPLQAVVIYRLASPVSAWTGLISTPTILLGEASYALYLFHGGVLAWVEAVAKMRLHSIAGEFPVYLSLRLPCAIAAVVLSVIVYRFIEVPARRAIRDGLKKYLHSPQHRHNPSPVETSIAAAEM